jgi:hypothetical protein
MAIGMAPPVLRQNSCGWNFLWLSEMPVVFGGVLAPQCSELALPGDRSEQSSANRSREVAVRRCRPPPKGSLRHVLANATQLQRSWRLSIAGNAAETSMGSALHGTSPSANATCGVLARLRSCLFRVGRQPWFAGKWTWNPWIPGLAHIACFYNFQNLNSFRAVLVRRSPP